MESTDEDASIDRGARKRSEITLCWIWLEYVYHQRIAIFPRENLVRLFDFSSKTRFSLPCASSAHKLVPYNVSPTKLPAIIRFDFSVISFHFSFGFRYLIFSLQIFLFPYKHMLNDKYKSALTMREKNMLRKI